MPTRARQSMGAIAMYMGNKEQDSTTKWWQETTETMTMVSGHWQKTDETMNVVGLALARDRGDNDKGGVITGKRQ